MRIRPVLLTIALMLLIPAAAMADGGTISGTVTLDGQPTSGLCVTVFDNGANAVGTATTDGFGGYHVYIAAPGWYTVRFDDCGIGYTTTGWYGSGLEIVSDVDSNGINGSLASAGIITGHVENEGGTPLEGVCVVVQDQNSVTIGGSSTDVYGNYEVHGLVAGVVNVEFSGCGSGNYVREHHDGIMVTAGETTQAVDAVLTVAGRITGHVENADGQPLENICVNGSANGVDLFGSLTDADGNYDIREVPPTGTYDLTAGDCFGTTYLTEHETGQLVPPNGSTFVGFTMWRPGSINGHVRDTDGGALASICVATTDTDTGEQSHEQTADNGYFEVNQIHPGTYDLTFSECAPTGKWEPATKTGVVVGDGATVVDVDAVLHHPDQAPSGGSTGGEAPSGGPTGAGSTGGSDGTPESSSPTRDAHPAGASTPPVVACKVPKLVGLSLAKAKKALAAAGCKLGKVTTKRAKRHGLVLRQKAGRGVTKPAGFKVALTIAK